MPPQLNVNRDRRSAPEHRGVPQSGHSSSAARQTRSWDFASRVFASSTSTIRVGQRQEHLALGKLDIESLGISTSLHRHRRVNCLGISLRRHPVDPNLQVPGDSPLPIDESRFEDGAPQRRESGYLADGGLQVPRAVAVLEYDVTGRLPAVRSDREDSRGAGCRLESGSRRGPLGTPPGRCSPSRRRAPRRSWRSAIYAGGSKGPG